MQWCVDVDVVDKFCWGCFVVVFLLLIEAAGEEIIDTFFIDSFDTQRELKLKYTPFGVTFWLCKTYL